MSNGARSADGNSNQSNLMETIKNTEIEWTWGQIKLTVNKWYTKETGGYNQIYLKILSDLHQPVSLTCLLHLKATLLQQEYWIQDGSQRSSTLGITAIAKLWRKLLLPRGNTGAAPIRRGIAGTVGKRQSGQDTGIHRSTSSKFKCKQKWSSWSSSLGGGRAQQWAQAAQWPRSTPSLQLQQESDSWDATKGK